MCERDVNYCSWSSNNNNNKTARPCKNLLILQEIVSCVKFRRAYSIWHNSQFLARGADYVASFYKGTSSCLASGLFVGRQQLLNLQATTRFLWV